MGNFDKWSTPKQIKMERSVGEPSRLGRRGNRKVERRKGKKARWDEVQSARRKVIFYREWVDESTDRSSWWMARLEKALKDYSDSYNGLLTAYLLDFGPKES